MTEPARTASTPAPAPGPKTPAQLLPRAIVIVLAIAAILVAINWAKPVLMPVAVAVLLHITFAPSVRVLKRAGVPTSLGAFVVVFTLVCGVLLVTWQIATPAIEWTKRLPEALPRLEAKMRDLKAPLQFVEDASAQVEKIATPNDDAAAKPFKVAIQEPSLSQVMLGEALDFVMAAGMVLVILYFLLSAEGAFVRKIVRVLPRFEDKRHAVEVIHGIERDVSRYMQTTVLVGLGVGVAEGFAMYALGMPNALLWGAIGCFLNWIPYLGALAGTAAVGMAALLTFDDSMHALLVAAVFFGITSIEGSFVTPVILGRRLTLNPVVLFVWWALWSWMWGLVGSLIAVPSLAALRIACDRFESLKTLGEFLSQRDVEAPHAAAAGNGSGAGVPAASQRAR